ncbi:unnamed protein product [Adineta ricciae]|uniref:Uncharacterized protein n=2 Tax=Adineta ricciae TaxID=249248 RepID=A0A813WY78_ADIRI|nr:unnamed protein product [Adineta ricciae]
MDDIEYPVFKSIDGPWIALLVIGILMFISSAIGTVLLYIVWRRFNQQPSQPTKNVNYVVNSKPNGNISIPVQINAAPSQTYETQKMELYVPQVDDIVNQRNFNEFYPNFNPEDAIQTVHDTYQRSKAYF